MTAKRWTFLSEGGYDAEQREARHDEQAWIDESEYLAVLNKVPAWQPIETAPRDSRKILVGSFNVYGEWRTYLAWWRLPYEGAPSKQCSWCYDKDGTLLDASIHSCGATHWMPLPAAPEPPA